MVNFVKEFEQIIIHNESDFSQLSIIPGSEAELYLQITQKLNLLKDEFPQSLSNDIEKFKKINPNAYDSVKLIALLREYELDSTNSERKEKILNTIRTQYFSHITFDYPKPVQNAVIDYFESNFDNEINKVSSSLDPKIFDPRDLIDKFINDTSSESESYLGNLNFEKCLKFFDFEKMPKEKLDLFIANSLDRLVDHPKFLDFVFLNLRINMENPNDSLSQLVPLLSVSDIEKCLEKLPTFGFKNLDLNILYIAYINLKYKSKLENLDDNLEERKILKDIYQYIKGKVGSQINVLKSDILLQILENGIKLNIYDFNIFIDYISLPSIMIESRYKQKIQVIKEVQSQVRRQFCNYLPKYDQEEALIVNKYLKYFFLFEKKIITDFSNFIQNDFLKNEYYQSLILRGEEKEDQINEIFSKDVYEKIIKRVEISICEHNKSVFNVDEPVKLEIDIKNIQTLFVKIFEIHTENYCLLKKSEMQSDVSLEGLVATYEESFSFNEKPKILLRKAFQLDKIPKKRGIYIVEFIGGGYSSRAVIKKGKLSIISRDSSSGKIVFILDENSEICKDTTKTSLIFQETRYNPNSEGLILIPYMKSPTTDNAIIIHEEFAQIASLNVPEENYSLFGDFILNHESLIMGNSAKVFLKLNLRVNNRPISIGKLENSKISLLIQKQEESNIIPINLNFDNIKPNENNEIEIEFQVPPRLVSLSINFDAEISNRSKEIKQKLGCSKIFNLNTNKDENSVIKPYLKQDKNHNYILSIFGKNGEPKSQIKVELVLKSIYFLEGIPTLLQTNSEGEIFLGNLEEIEHFSGRIFENVNDFGFFFILPKKIEFSYPSEINIIKNEKISLPYAYSTIDRYNVKLINRTYKEDNLQSKLSIEALDEGHFQLNINDLDEGVFTLMLGESNYINIKVHSGKYWNNYKNFIQKENCLIENLEYKDQIHIKKLEIINDSSKIKLKVNENSKNPRVHLSLFHYLPNSPNDNFIKLNNQFNKLKGSIEHQYSQWENVYMNNRLLNEEIQYVFDRKQLERYMGSTIEKPSLLLKRKFVRDTSTEVQVINQGTNYKVEEKKKQRSKLCKKESQDYYTYNDLQYQDNIYHPEFSSELIISGYHNWVNHSPFMLLNNIPNDEGEIEVEIKNLNKYSYIQITCFDENSVCVETVNLSNLVESRDIRLQEPLEIGKYFSKLRKIDTVYKNSNYLIRDIISTQFKILDCLENYISFQLLISPQLSSDWNKFKFLFKIPELSETELKKQISEYFSHEMNIFLYFKFEEFFNKYIRDIIKFKSEKSFIDYFLLNDMDSIREYAQPSKLKLLNCFEKCLLILKIKDENISLAHSISVSISLQAEEYKPAPEIFNKYFNVMMNMKSLDVKKEEKVILDMLVETPLCADMAPMGKGMPVAMSMSAAPRKMMMMARNIQKKEIGPDLEYDDFESKINQNLDQMNRRNNLFKEAGKSKEYRETHYYHSLNNHNSLVLSNLFWSDFSKAILEGKKQFLSKNIILPLRNITELIFATSIIDIPIKSSNHKFERKSGNSVEIQNSTNIIVITSEITETKSNKSKDLMISQHISKIVRSEETVNEFLVNEYYQHETIVTNVSSKNLTFELLIQIPKGSLPIKNSLYTNTINVNLEKFNTTSIVTYFYFTQEGIYTQFPPSASIDGEVISEGIPKTYEVKTSIIKENSKTLDDVLIGGNKKNILEFLNNQNFININDITKILWLLKDKESFNAVIDIFSRKGIYDDTVWAFGFYHKNENVIKQYLENSYITNLVGPEFSHKLIEVDNTNNFNVMNHLDYHPIINSRAHGLGQGRNYILNREFKETYEKFIVFLLSQKKITNKNYLRLTYYLLLQDRIEEAIITFKKIDVNEFTEFNDYRIQYDYISSYIDFYIGYPHFDTAREIVKKYKNITLSNWKELFEEVEDQLNEFSGEDLYGDVDNMILEEKNKKKKIQEVINQEPKLAFSIENKSLSITHSNIDKITIKFYFIDLEILFSRRPFLKQQSDDFSFVVPNFVYELEVTKSEKESLSNFQIPEEYQSRNLFIEVSSKTKKTFETYFSTSLKITITENLGEVKVTNDILAPLNKVYVKCFAKLKNQSIKFYKDGYTDLRGKFNYISLNTEPLSNISKFAIFIMDDTHGSIIKEASPPENIEDNNDTNAAEGDYDKFKNYRQNVKENWKNHYQYSKSKY